MGFVGADRMGFSFDWESGLGFGLGILESGVFMGEEKVGFRLPSLGLLVGLLNACESKFFVEFLLDDDGFVDEFRIDRGAVSQWYGSVDARHYFSSC